MTNELHDFEAGEDVTDEFEEPRRPGGMVVSVRLAPEDADRLVDLAEQTGQTVSQIARQAIRTFLLFGERETETREVTIVSVLETGKLTVRTNLPGVSTQGLPSHAHEDRANGILQLA